MTNADRFKGIFGIYATELWAKTEKEFLEWLNEDVPETTVGDTISRQAAIDIERNATVDTNPSHFEAHQKFTQFMDDAEISSFGRWQWPNGFNTALTAVGIDLKELPSAQRWIPCSERLPDSGRQVLVFARSVNFALAKYDEMREADGTYKKQWVTFDAWKPFYTIKDAIAWMPLPKPLEGET